MTPAPNLRSIVAGVRRVVRRDAALALALIVLSAVPAALLAAWVSGLLRPWSRPGFGPLAFDALVLGVAGTLLWLGVRRWLRRIDEAAIAADAERRAGMPAGTVRGVLELSVQVPDGTSPALARRAEYEIASRFSGLQPRDITGDLGARVRRRRSAAAAVFTVLTSTALLLAFAAPEHSRAAWAPLASPVTNLTQPLLPPLRVLPGNASVTRGASLPVQIEAQGRDVVTLRWRVQGDVPREEIAAVQAGRAAAAIPRIDAPTDYWIESPDGAVSPRFRITPVDPLLVSDLAVDVVYPRHVARAADRYTGDVPPLEVPEGTQLLVRGRATRALQAAELVVSDEARMRFTLDGDGFSGSFTPSSTARYEWRLQDVRGEDLSVQPAPLDITVIADGAPLVEIAWPERDTILDASLRQSIVADARDDYGLTAAALVSWRIGRDGRRYGDVEEMLPLAGDDRALIRALLDASNRELVPGDTLKFFVRVTDNSPRRQSAVSRTVSLRLPHAGELRELSVDRADTLVSQAAALAKNAAELQDMMRTLERRTAASNARQRAQQQSGGRSSAGAQSERMSFQDAAQARQLLERQDELLQRIESMRRNIAELERAMERAGLRDAQLQERLAELREMYDEMLSPEVKQQLEQLRRALEQMDPEELQRVLEQMTRQQEQMKQQLEAGVEMMKQAAAEQEVNNLAQEARELATQQQALAEAIREQGRATPEQARAQQELANRSQELAQDLAEMQQRLEQHGETDAAEQTKAAEQAAREAGQQMQQAARDAQRNGSNAAESGDRAAQQLEQAAENLDRARQSMADARRQEAQESVQQAMSEALSLAQRQQQLLDQMKEAEANAQQAGDSVQVVKPPQQPGAPQLPRPPEPQVRIGSERQQEQQRSGQQRSGQQQGDPQQGQQGGQQQQGAQQQGQQGGRQQQSQQGGQQGQQQGGQQRGQQGEGQRAGEQGQQGAGERGDGRQGQAGQQGQGAPDAQGMRAEQTALRQGLQQLSRNLQEAAERTGGMNRDVSASLARANLSMEQTLQAMENGTMPIQQAQQTVESLNRLALSLLTSAQQMDHSEAGSAGQQSSQQQMADLAKQQGSLNGQANSLQPMNLSAGAMSQQLNRLAQEQMEIARRLGNLNQGGNAESIMGDVDALAGEAEELARRMRSGSGLSPEVLARQERLFHRLLDAGRTLEKDEYEEERVGERARAFDARNPGALDPRLFQDPTRFRAPTQEELQALPPAYRRMILDYFERLNRAPAPNGGSR